MGNNTEGRTVKFTDPQRKWLGNPSRHVYAFEWDPMALKLAAKGFIEWKNDYSASRRGFVLTDAGRAALNSKER